MLGTLIRAAGLPAVFAGLLLLLVPTVGGAQERTVVIAGRVIDESGSPVPMARVELVGSSRAVAADSRGEWSVRVAPGSGTTVLAVSQIGYSPRRISVAITSDTSRVEVVLEQLPVSLGEVQVTATPVAREPLAVAQSTTTISGRELERTSASTIGSMLAAQAGISTRWQGPAASAPVIRGMSGDRVLVLQDGVRSGDLSSTAPDHAITIDPTSASRIEVVRGPAALLYGNNAVGGVVNVVSDDVPRLRPERFSGSIAALGESGAPGGSMVAHHSGPLGAGALRARGGVRYHDDVGTGGGWLAPRLDNTRSRSEFASLGFALPKVDRSAGAAVRAYRFGYGLPIPTGLAEDAVTLEGDRVELVARAEREGMAGALSSYRIDASAQSYRHDEIFADGVVGTRLAARTFTAGATIRPGSRVGLRDAAFGVSAYHRANGVSGNAALTPANNASAIGAFAFEELGVASVRIPVGVRIDRFSISTHTSARFGPGVRRDYTGVSGSVGAVAPLAAGSSLALSIARAVRSPTSEELFSQAGHTGTGAFEIGDPDLTAEVTTGVDAIVRVERRRVAMQLAAYFTGVDGYIGLYPAGRDTVVADGEGGEKALPLFVISQRRASFRGFDGSIDAALSQSFVLRISGDGVIARDAAGEPLPFIPAARAAIGLRYDDNRRSAGVDVRHTLRQGPVPDGELRTGRFTLVDLHGGVRLVAGGQAHLITLRVQNATNVLYRDASSRVKEFAPNPGRSFMVGYRVAY